MRSLQGSKADAAAPGGEKARGRFGTVGARVQGEAAIGARAFGRLVVEETQYYHESMLGEARTDADDKGMALTLHQPLATLIVAGFKRAEGRGWAHPYRGRLWIHAASKPPEDEDIARYESFYTSLYGERGLPMPNFPSSYPTSCLVGCIDAEDQLQHEDYMEFSEKEEERIRNGAARDEWVWPTEENGSEYVFICHRPRQLVVPVTASDSNQLLRCGC